jgi:formylglycine-generating enzyme required for sulfatase activity
MILFIKKIIVALRYRAVIFGTIFSAHTNINKKNVLTMKNQLISYLAFATLSVLLIGCGKSKSAKTTASNGQLVGATYSAKVNNNTHLGMVHIPQGTFHMGPSDEDINYSFTARNRQMSISGFWMDVTEITNREYKQFVFDV